jgi:hypothetical protein
MNVVQTVTKHKDGETFVTIILRDERNRVAHSGETQRWFEDGDTYETHDFDWSASYGQNVIDALFLHNEIRLKRAIYDRVQRYGGSEEGGWYYHNLTPTEGCDDEELGLNGYGEGFVERYELFDGEFTDDQKRHYE